MDTWMDRFDRLNDVSSGLETHVSRDQEAIGNINSQLEVGGGFECFYLGGRFLGDFRVV